MTEKHIDDTRCPSCNELIAADAEACEHCHAHKINNYVSREARLKIRLLASIVAAVLLLVFLLSAAFTNHTWLLGVVGLLLSLAVWLSIYKALTEREKKKNVTVWKRRTLTW